MNVLRVEWPHPFLELFNLMPSPPAHKQACTWQRQKTPAKVSKQWWSSWSHAYDTQGKGVSVSGQRRIKTATEVSPFIEIRVHVLKIRFFKNFLWFIVEWDGKCREGLPQAYPILWFYVICCPLSFHASRIINNVKSWNGTRDTYSHTYLKRISFPTNMTLFLWIFNKKSL